MRVYVVLLLALVLTPVHTKAQESANKIDITQLQRLFDQQLNNADDTYIQQLIDDERAEIRDIIEEEYGSTFVTVYDEEILDEEALTRAVDRQRGIIASIQERMRDRKVDLDLLNTEEQRYYKDPLEDTGTTVDTFRLTRSYPELLAKKAVLQERIGVLESLLALQDARLQQLVYDQRLQQFALLIIIAKYFVIVLLVLVCERMVRRLALSRIGNIDYRYMVTKIFTSSVYILTLLWILGVVFSKQPGLLASLAIVGAGLAIALQDVVKDMLGWFIIVQNRLFTRGHRITVGSITGEVVDFRLLRTTLLEIGLSKSPGDMAAVLERTGKVLSLPNALYLTQPLTNHSTTSDFVRAEMRVTITFESNWQKAQEICKQIIDEITDEYIERDQKQTRYRMQMLYLPHRTAGNQVYFDIAADGVELTLRFTVPIGERRPIVSEISDRVLHAFRKEGDVHLAYATQRILAEVIEKNS